MAREKIPKGMKVKKVPRKRIEFDNNIAPVENLPDAGPGIYTSVVRKVIENSARYDEMYPDGERSLLYPQFQTSMESHPEYVSCWAFFIQYELTDSAGKRYRYEDITEPRPRTIRP